MVGHTTSMTTYEPRTIPASSDGDGYLGLRGQLRRLFGRDTEQDKPQSDQRTIPAVKGG